MSGTRWELTKDDPDYPSCLRCSPRPPERLYGLGAPALLSPGLAIVGSRKATPYGRSCARRFSRWAARQGIIVVSGAAAGCDLAAHEAALEEGGPTVAVLGCGADVDYPASASSTLALIRDRGAVLSEVPWGTPPRRWAFPDRNRIIAALARAVLVVEAALPSGTFSTADHALAAGREVLAVPGSIFSAGSEGTNRLISQGALPVTCEADLAQALELSGLHTPSGPAATAIEPEGDPVLAAVLADPMRPDDLALATGLDVVEVVRRLASLESGGVVRRDASGRYGPG